MVAYLRFELRRLRRNGLLLVLAALMPMTIYVLVTRVEEGSRVAVEGVAVPGAAYAMVALAAFGAVMGVLSISSGVSQERQSGWLRQLRATPLPAHRVPIAKGAVSTLVALPAFAAVAASAVTLHGLSLPPGRWVAVAAVLWLGTAPFAMLGLAVGYALPPQQSTGVTMLSWLAFAALGGWITSIEDFPGWLQQVTRFTPSFRYTELAWRVAGGDVPTLAGVAILAGWAGVFGGLAGWTYRRFAAVR